MDSSRSSSTMTMRQTLFRVALATGLIGWLCLASYGQRTRNPTVEGSNNHAIKVDYVDLTEDEMIVGLRVPRSKEGFRISSATALFLDEDDFDKTIYMDLELYNSDDPLERELKIKECEILASKNLKIVGLGDKQLDKWYPVNGEEWSRFNLHFPRLPMGVEVFHVRALVKNGLALRGIHVRNPYPAVENTAITYEKAKATILEQHDGSLVGELTGIYEGLGQNKYQVACLKHEGGLKLIYLGGITPSDYWRVGDVKATLRQSVLPKFYLATWYGKNRRPIEAVVTFEGIMAFEGIIMSVTPNGRQDAKMEFLKMFPTLEMNSERSVPGGAVGKSGDGTGFALPGGYIVTNFHVANAGKRITAVGVNGQRGVEYATDVVAVDKKNDLALLKIVDSRFTGYDSITYTIRREQAAVGEEIFVLGYPLTPSMGSEIKLTTGVISATTGFQDDPTLYQFSAPVQPGNSGGPMFDAQGNLVGVVCAKHVQAENASYAVKVPYLIALAETVKDVNLMPSKNLIGACSLAERVRRVRDFVFLLNVYEE